MSHRNLLAMAAAAAALAVAGCGSDDDGSTTAEEPAQDSSPVVIEAEKGAFDPQAVFESASPAVVTITSILPESDNPLAGPGPQAGQGSGFVISDEGEIATNAHVVTDGQADGASEINAAKEVFVQFPDRNQVEAKIVGFDPFADVALLEVDPEGLDLHAIELGKIDEVDVGDPVAAIGSPFGERQSLSVGVVSANDRSIPSLTEFQIGGAIQTDASINPGNSGGPLLDAEARVIGINQQIDTTSGGNQGVGFAVPIDLATRAINQLREDGKVDYAFLGVGTRPMYPQLAERLDLDTDTGALVERVEPDSPAEDAGLKPGDQRITFQGLPYRVGGDVIVAVDGQKVVGENDLAEYVSRADPGQSVKFEVVRGDDRVEVDVKLGTRSATSS